MLEKTTQEEQKSKMCSERKSYLSSKGGNTEGPKTFSFFGCSCCL